MSIKTEPYYYVPSSDVDCRSNPSTSGAGRKMSGGSGRHQLAPNAKCSVCNDDASGFHYGVDSCEGCKGFFRRCITQGINFRCSNEEKCQITPFTRNSCQYCRLKRCFQVGMSREASRLGRRPKKVMKTSVLSSRDLQNQLMKHMETKPCISPTDSNQANWDYPSLAKATLSDMFGCPPEFMQQMMPMMMHQFNQGHNTPDQGHYMDMSMGAAQQAGFPMLGQTYPGNDQNQSAGNAAEETVTRSDLDRWREKQFEVMSKYMHTNKDNIGGDETNGSQAATGTNDNVSGISSSMFGSEALSKDFSPLSSTSGYSTMSCSSSTVENIIDILQVSEEQQLKLDKYIAYCQAEHSNEMLSLIYEVRQAIISSHMEHCFQLRPRVNAASAELDVREQAGESVRPPKGFWAHWMSELLPTIEKVVRFLKDVPGFRELPMNDQILLIKKSAFSIIIAQAIPMLDPDKNTILDPQLKYRNHRSELVTFPGPFQKLFEDQFVLAKEFQPVQITDIETGLLNALLGVNSGIQGFENPIAIEKLERLFVQTLHNYELQQYPDNPGRFQNLLRLIPALENMSVSHLNTLNSIKCNSSHFSSLSNVFPPLHKEIFSGDV